MASFAIHDLQELLGVRADCCVSLYVPMEVAGPETRQNPIRLKNALRQATSELERSGPRGAAEELLEPATGWLNDPDFWQHRRPGFAAFLARGIARHYLLPMHVDELVVVTGRFHVKPLLALLQGDGRFAVLALSGNQARLLDCTRDAGADVTPAAMPAGMADALKYDQPEAQLQFHTGTPGGGSGDRAAVYHGQGVGTDDRKDRFLRYFRTVDSVVCAALGEQRTPLVLAGVEYLLPIYREASSYSPILEGGVAGNPDEQSVDALRSAAWEIVAPHFAAERAKAEDTYLELRAKGRGTADLAATLRAAHQGRVACLFTPVGVQAWGRFEADTGRIARHREPRPGDEDLLDRAAVSTLLAGGTVYAVPPEAVPNGDLVAAVLRY